MVTLRNGYAANFFTRLHPLQRVSAKNSVTEHFIMPLVEIDMIYRRNLKDSASFKDMRHK